MPQSCTKGPQTTGNDPEKPIHAAPPWLQFMLLTWKNTVTLYSMYLEKTWSWQITLADFLPTKKNQHTVREPPKYATYPIQPWQIRYHLRCHKKKPCQCNCLPPDPQWMAWQSTRSAPYQMSLLGHQRWVHHWRWNIVKREQNLYPSSVIYERTFSDLHDSNKGVKKMQHLARVHVYWPGNDANILYYINRWTIYTRFKVTQGVQPMLLRDIPHRPWQELGTDYFTHNGKENLLIVDTFSKYPFIHKTHPKTSGSLIQHLKELISQYGPPKWFFIDNESLAKFLSPQCIDHITSSPFYIKSNRCIECQIKTIKTALITIKASRTSIDHLHMTLRSTLIGPHLSSLHEILHNCTDDHPGQPSHPVVYEEVGNYLIAKKKAQTKRKPWQKT